MSDPVIEELSEDECLELISAGGIGRIAFTGRYGPVVLPVNYRLHDRLHDKAIVFRTTEHSPLDEDLKTGIEGAEYIVAFEVDQLDSAVREGWSVLIQGPAHHVTEDDRSWAEEAGVESWAPGDRELFVRIIPIRTTGRRIVQA